jgi:hypothetical protein
MLWQVERKQFNSFKVGEIFKLSFVIKKLTYLPT